MGSQCDLSVAEGGWHSLDREAHTQHRHTVLRHCDVGKVITIRSSSSSTTSPTFALAENVLPLQDFTESGQFCSLFILSGKENLTSRTRELFNEQKREQVASHCFSFGKEMLQISPSAEKGCYYQALA